jgi:hypothetical protein
VEGDIMITIRHSGNFDKTEKFFKRMSDAYYLRLLERYGMEGVMALSSATPVDSGETSKCWDYKISRYPGGATITWTNSNIVDGVPIAVLIQYGHGTRNGGYVQGRDYINPAMRPIFDKIATDAWREVNK